MVFVIGDGLSGAHFLKQTHEGRDDSDICEREATAGRWLCVVCFCGKVNCEPQNGRENLVRTSHFSFYALSQFFFFFWGEKFSGRD